MNRILSRRDFLKLSGAAALGLTLSRPRFVQAALSSETPIGLGRAIHTLRRYDKPSFSSKKVGWARADSALNLYEEQTGDAESSHNSVWFRVDEGWVHSAYVQPVQNVENEPILEIPKGGFLVEMTVPFTDAWHTQNGATTVAYRFYYASTHWANRATTDRKGNVWYRVIDDRYGGYYFVLAKHLRRVPEEELTPLSPEVSDKRIEVDIAQQLVTAYENGSAVFTARTATGRKGVETPKGEFRVERKRPSRHMASDDSGGNGFDLPGVPWVAYFYWTGVAFHGTYWHNDYGRPRSGGCVNLTPADAKWIYRWTLPVVPPNEPLARDKNGTKVVVF